MGGGWLGTSLQRKIRTHSQRDMLYSIYGLCPYLAEQGRCSLTGLKIDRAAFCMDERTPQLSRMERGRGTPDTAKRSATRDTTCKGEEPSRGERSALCQRSQGPAGHLWEKSPFLVFLQKGRKQHLLYGRRRRKHNRIYSNS